ncbi:hypothetical protein O9G_000504 [Rozella allomycis CSF55]|uniref:WD40 repeat-like protein n=1 Tax=Rozella allomycis (strain CSF55) TaxID=988480 RepID=A0A075B035_ROZAC|nr:hypothetical protein O9G_000504 [Rozella allomycis CSF55]|eukprot:EPZ34317.1 hypothetical protein O9G_000504 [Rozella allomycis CSF55]
MASQQTGKSKIEEMTDSTRTLMSLIQQKSSNSLNSENSPTNFLSTLKSATEKIETTAVKAEEYEQVEIIEEDIENRFEIPYAKEYLKLVKDDLNSNIKGDKLEIDVKKPNLEMLATGTFTETSLNLPSRVFHQENGKKTLLKGHTQSVLDMEFCPSNEKFLASISVDGSMIVWQIEKDVEENIMHYKIVFELKGTKMVPNRFRKVSWHRTNPGILFFVTSQNEIYKIKIHETEKQGEILVLNEKNFMGMKGFVFLGKISAPIRDLVVSEDNQLLIVGTDEGMVRIFDANEQEPCKVSLNVAQNHPVTRVFYFKETSLLVALSEYNNVIHLWDVEGQKCLQTINFKLDDGLKPTIIPPFNAVYFDKETNLLALGNAARRSVYLIQLNLDKKVLSNIAEFTINQQVLSFAFTLRSMNNEDNLVFYCVHPQSICLQTISVQNIPFKVEKEARKDKENVEITGLLSPTAMMKFPKKNIQKPLLKVSIEENEKNKKITSPKMKTQNDIKTQIEIKSQNEKSPSNEFNESLIMNVNQTISSGMAAFMEPLIKSEMQKSILPCIQKSVSSYLDKNISSVIQQTFQNSSLFEKVIQDALVKTLSKPNVTEKIVNGIIPSIESTVRKNFETKLVPAYERATQQMIKQISNGINGNETKDLLLDIKKNLSSSIADSVAEKVEASLKPLILRSSNEETPNDPMKEVFLLIENKNYIEAFVKVLNASKLELVVQLCSSLNPKETFKESGPGKLNQPVAVALIQQLAYDLTSDIDLKFSWIREALFFIQPNDEEIADHVSAVLNGLVQNLENFASTREPSGLGKDQLARKAKLICNVVRAVLEQ